MSKFEKNAVNSPLGKLIGLNKFVGSKTKDNVITPGDKGDINMEALYAALGQGLFGVYPTNLTPQGFINFIKTHKSLLYTNDNKSVANNSQINNSKIKEIKESKPTVKINNINQSFIDNINDINTTLSTVKENLTKINQNLDQSFLNNIKDISIALSAITNQKNSEKDSVIIGNTNGSLNINFTGLNNLNKDNLESFVDFIDILVKISNKQININKENLQKLNDFFTQDNILNQIFKSISELSVTDETKIKNVENLSNILDLIIDTLNIEKINVKNLSLLSYVTSKGQYVDQIFTNIQQIGSKKNDVNKNLYVIKDIFEALTSIMDVGPLQRYNIKNNVKFINDNIIDSIKDIASKIESLEQNNNDIYKSINNLTSIFQSIGDISNIDIKKRFITQLNISFVKKHILPSIIDILNSIIKISNNVSKDGVDSIENINNLFNTIFKVIDIKLMTLIKLDFKTRYLNSIIKDNIIDELIKDILDKLSTNNSIEKINNLINLYSQINLLTEAINGIKLDSVSKNLFILKHITLDDIIDIVNAIGNVDNKGIPDITDNYFGKLSNIKKIFQKIIDLNTIISTVNYNDFKSNINNVNDIINRIQESLKYLLSYESYNTTIFSDFNTIIKNIHKLEKSIDGHDYNKLINDIDNISKLFVVINSVKGLIPTDLPEVESLDNFASSLENILNNFNIWKNENLQQAIIDSEEQIESINILLTNIISIIDNWPKDISLNDKSLNDFLTNELTPVLKAFRKNGNIGKNIKDLVVIDNQQLQNIENIKKLISDLSSINVKANFIIGNPLGRLENSVESIKNIINKFNSIKPETIDKANNALKGIMTVVTMSAAVLILGSLAMSKIDAEDLILFTVSLGGFLFGLTKIINKLDLKNVKSDINTIQSILILVGGCATIMILGSLAMNLIEIPNLIGFSVGLSILVIGVGFATKLMGNISSKTLEDVENFMSIVVACGSILILGSLAMNFTNIYNVVGFAITLSMFVAAMGLIFVCISKVIEEEKNIIANIDKFAKAVMMLGGILILGSLAMNFIKGDNLTKFAVTLTLFTLTFCTTLLIINKIFENSQEIFSNLNKFATTIAICGAVMLLGSILVSVISFKNLFIFTASLALFITLVSLPFLIFNKVAKNIFIAARDFTILVTVCAGIMILGSYFATDFKFIKNAFIFGLALGGFIMLISWALKLAASEIKSNMASALAFVTLVGLSTLILYIANLLIEKYPDLLMNTLMFTGSLIILIGGMGLVLGLMGKFWTYIGIGMLCALGILAIITVTGLITIAISELNKKITWGDVLEGTAKIFTTIILAGTFIAVIGTLLSGTGPVGAAIAIGLIIGAVAILAIGAVTYVAASVVQKIADVGKLIDETSAKESIDKIFGVMEYASEKMIGILNGGNPIVRTVKLIAAIKTYKEIGEVLGVIAQGVQQWANLRIPTEFDEKGHAIAFTTLADKDFTTMADHIEDVLTAIGYAITNTYNNANNKAIFDDPLIGKSPMHIIVSAMSKTGNMLNSIARGVQQWANLKFPEYDKNGNVIKYFTLSEKELKDALPTNIEKILTALGTALGKTVSNYPEVFKDGGLFKDSPAEVAAKAMKNMGDILNNIANSIAYYASGKFPLWKDGKIYDYITLNDTQMDNASIRIKSILVAIGEAIKETVKDPNNKEIFNEGTFTDAPAMVAAKAIANMATAINTVVDIIGKLSQLELDQQLNKLPELKSKINDILVWTCEVLNLFTNNKIKNSENNEISIGKRKGLVGDILNMWKGDLSIGDYINENLPDMEEAIKGISNITKNINSLVTKINELSETFKKSDLTGINNFNKTKLKNTNILILEIQKDILEIGNENEDKLNMYISYNKKVIDFIKQLTNTINKYNLLSDTINKHIEIKQQKLNEVLSTKTIIIDLQKSIQGIGGNSVQTLNRYIMYDKKVIEAVKTIIKVINSYDNVIDTINKIKNINKSKLNNVLVLSQIISNIGNTLSVKKISSEDFDILCNGLQRTYETVSKFEESENFKSYINSMSKFIEIINRLNVANKSNNNDIVNKIKSLIGIQQAIQSIGNNSVQVLNRYMLYDEKIINVINKINSVIASYNDVIQKINNSRVINNSKLNSLVKLSEVINIILNSFNEQQNNKIKQFDILCEGLTKVYNTLNQFENIKGFTNYTKDLSSFIEKINELDISKLSQVHSLINAINDLSTKLNGLDKFGESIAQKITIVLSELVAQLHKAETSINNAHALQEQRKKLIEDSLHKVKDIMDKHMIVEIYNKTNDKGEVEGPKPFVNGKELNNTASSTESESMSQPNSSQPTLESPENAQLEKPDVKDIIKDDALTETAFKTLMRQYMKEGLWTG